MDFLTPGMAPFFVIVGLAAIVGWVVTTWMKIKHGYPLENGWGQPLHPKVDREVAERLKLMTGENAQLRAELGAMKDRLATVERIVTDDSTRLAKEIEALSLDKGGHA